ncbi:winged helix DNA-binding domain-containing protein [Dyadobacter sp. CY326]|uniref:winged helix DNA-binding domain-containing protein n=1 Tax=Dyadobacter sp. CY326 TaxID=2907300 RepID=UPI001F1A4518|nr:winged helix DNA-binding domain-containing protein [Dyadobacter sp. CY326]MCE7066186.1 winged helix DNA-binding domain-containing protein [Dyadobacter sp. CY326]
MTIDELLRLRLYNQQISHHPSETPEQVVSWMCAMQAQDYAGAKWSIGLRMPGKKETDIDDAIAKKAIVRTWPMRGTLHFVAADDVRWLLKLLTPRIISGTAGRRRQLELDENALNKSRDVITRALEGGKQMMRSEVYALLEANGISAGEQRGIHIINHLAQKQVISHGIHNDKQPTYVLLDEWIPSSKNLEGEAALSELALRYFRSHGPATLNDFVWWSGLRISDARLGLNSASDLLEKIELNDKIFWLNPDHPPLGELESAYLLPGFDEYMLGYTDRTLILDTQHASKIVPGNNGMFMPTIVVNGKVEGLWKKALKRDQISIEIFPFGKITNAKMKAIISRAKDYGHYLDKIATLSN